MTRNRQRTRLVSRVIGLGIVALLIGTAAPAAQGAALQPIVARMIRALSAVSAYKMIDDSTISGGGAMMGGASTTHLEVIRTHRGPTAQLSMRSETRMATGPVRISEMVVSGTRGCVRTSPGAAWNCHYPAAAFAAMLNADQAKALQATGLRLLMTPMGRSRTIGGRTCALYTFTETMTVGITLTMHGTWCLDPATALPVEVDAVGTETLVKGQPPFTTRSTTLYSRWNDATLRVPVVPGM